jgi:hypothetical protein
MRILPSKTSAEKFFIDFDFTEADVSDDIATATVTAVNNVTGVAVTSTVTDVTKQVITSPHVYVFVQVGTVNEDYLITCKITTDTDPVKTFEVSALLPIRDVTYGQI